MRESRNDGDKHYREVVKLRTLADFNNFGYSTKLDKPNDSATLTSDTKRTKFASTNTYTIQ